MKNLLLAIVFMGSSAVYGQSIYNEFKPEYYQAKKEVNDSLVNFLRARPLLDSIKSAVEDTSILPLKVHVIGLYLNKWSYDSLAVSKAKVYMIDRNREVSGPYSIPVRAPLKFSINIFEPGLEEHANVFKEADKNSTSLYSREEIDVIKKLTVLGTRKTGLENWIRIDIKVSSYRYDKNGDGDFHELEYSGWVQDSQFYIRPCN
ncbi:MAG TPA: hypothetical protein VF868_08535 [Bacteroidia bacterium]|jgi:uncharacterized protein YceK